MISAVAEITNKQESFAPFLRQNTEGAIPPGNAQVTGLFVSQP